MGPRRGLHRGRIIVHFGDPFTLDRKLDREVAGRQLMEAIAAARDQIGRDPVRTIAPHRFRKPIEGNRIRKA
jgi:hypothetical protein